MMSRKIKKRAIALFASVILLALCFAFPSYAWGLDTEGYMTISSGYNCQQVGYYYNDLLQITAVHMEYRTYYEGEYHFDYIWFVDAKAIYDQLVLLGGEATPERLISSWTASGAVYSQSILKAQIQRILDTHTDIYGEGYTDGYGEGYTDGIAEGNIAENTILTILSAPAYVLSTIFNFEIFGLNAYTLVTFVLTISLVGVVLKKLL